MLVCCQLGFQCDEHAGVGLEYIKAHLSLCYLLNASVNNLAVSIAQATCYHGFNYLKIYLIYLNYIYLRVPHIFRAPYPLGSGLPHMAGDIHTSISSIPD